MKALILAAGYAIRLYPLTETVAKPLLPLAGRPMLDYLLDKIREVPDIDEVHLVTNHKFAADFAEWASGRGVTVHDDGTTSEDDKLGAIGDTQFVIERVGIDDGLLVIAGDNLFDYSLADATRWWQSKGAANAVVVYDVGDLELVKQYSNVELDENDRLTSFIEKPQEPNTTLAATAAYFYHRSLVPRIREYLDEGNSPDQPGRLVAWFVPRAPVYGYRVSGDWRDIGDAAQLLDADNHLRAETGLPTRAAYSLD